jgi:hypothetical protein
VVVLFELGHGVGEQSNTKPLYKMARLPWALGQGGIEINTASGFPAVNKNLQRHARHTQRVGDVVGGSQWQDRDRRAAANDFSGDFIDRSIASGNGDDVARLLQRLLPLLFFRRLIFDLVPCGANQFNNFIARRA